MSWARSFAMDGAAQRRRRTAQKCLPFPLRWALYGAPSLHCKRASPKGRCALSRWQAALRAVEVIRNRRGSGETVAFKNGVR
jgi:hypothetical protein